MGALDGIPAAISFPPKKKYLVVAIKFGGEQKVVLLTGPLDYYQYHSFLKDSLVSYLKRKPEYKGAEVSALGGGWIQMDDENNTILACETSGDFGEEPERDTRTKSLLETLFPGYVVTTEPAPKRE